MGKRGIFWEVMGIKDKEKNMRHFEKTIDAIFIILFTLLIGCVHEAKGAIDYPYKPVPFTNVKFTDTFWSSRIEMDRAVTIPFAFKKCEETGRIDNFKIAAKLMEGTWKGRGFNDTDPYKIIEGASYGLMVKPDSQMDAYLDKLIGYIAAAQEPDGYLYTAWTAGVREHSKIFCCYKERWDNLKLGHELYNAGHMYEAAVAHYLATGKRSFLDIAIKNANLVCDVFGPGKNEGVPGHQEIELGLVKLYRVTGYEKYLKQAKWFLDQRGRSGYKAVHSQSHIPVTEQTEAVGHAVRAGYMYSGMADVAALTGDEAYVKAIDAIWNNVADKKLYVTGGIGSRGHDKAGTGEAFGDDYELPNATAYCETCANISNVYWNHRMFLLHGESKYIDVMERALYNSVISGVSLDGTRFFYPNPLECDGDYERSEWFGCACCPGNLTRFLASVSGYAYAVRGREVYVNLFGQSQATVEANGKKITLVQKTEFPWDGKVAIDVKPETDGINFTLKIRIPDWATNEFSSSGLYSFAEPLLQSVIVQINDKKAPLQMVNGYVSLDRTWKQGDKVQVDLPMPVRRIVCDGSVKDNVGKITLQRGPLVYCVEWPDVEGGKVLNLMIKKDAPLEIIRSPDLLGGVVVIEGTAMELTKKENGRIEQTPRKFQAIPYYAWAHRGEGQMAVWIPTIETAIVGLLEQP